MKTLKLIAGTLVLGILFYSCDKNEFTPEIGSGLAGHYPFNGNAHDVSGSGLNGTLQGATLTEDRFGTANSAFSFDGSPGYISLPNEFDFQARSISLWFKAPATNYGSAYGAIYQSDNPSILYGVSGIAVRDTDTDDKKELILGISEVQYLSDINIDTWYNITMTVNTSKEVHLYIDGVVIHEDVFVNYNKSVNGIENAIIGAGRHTLNSYFNGVIDDVRIYDRALTQEEVSLIFQLTE